jgi:putative restriction endonuclease
VHGDALPRRELESGFDFQGSRVPLLGPQGIFKPAILDVPLSITTAPRVPGKPAPYDDSLTKDGLLAYRYRGSDPHHRDNVGLRIAMREHIPLIYFHGLVPGYYAAARPVFIVGDDPSSLSFTVAIDDSHAIGRFGTTVADDFRRRYVTRLQMQRLHQASFRERVIRAYRQTCAVCRLRHDELLDAAHILPDTHPKGEPVIPNGLSLCKLHHAAFDRNIIGIRPDLVIEVSMKVLREIDGPMLRHGLQGFHEQRLIVPRHLSERPDRERLEERYEEFRKAG